MVNQQQPKSKIYYSDGEEDGEEYISKIINRYKPFVRKNIPVYFWFSPNC